MDVAALVEQAKEIGFVFGHGERVLSAHELSRHPRESGDPAFSARLWAASGIPACAGMT
jgi:hypothetical protein